MNDDGVREQQPTAALSAESRCPYCAETIQPGAQKCPHCRELLDPALRLREERRFGDGVARSIGIQELQEKILHSVIASAVGIFVFCVAGSLFGPMAFLFALYYHRRVRSFELETPGTLIALYVLSGLWTLVGILFIVLLAFSTT